MIARVDCSNHVGTDGTTDMISLCFFEWAYIMPSKSITFYHSISSHDERHNQTMIPFQATRFLISYIHLYRIIQYSGSGYPVHMEPVVRHDRPYYSEYIFGHELKGVRFRVQRSSWLQHLDARITIQLHASLSANGDVRDEQVQVLNLHKQSSSSTDSFIFCDNSSCNNNTGLVLLIDDLQPSIVVNEARYFTSRFGNFYIREFNMPLIIDRYLQLPITITGPWHMCALKLRLIMDDRHPITDQIIRSLCNRNILCIPHA